MAGPIPRSRMHARAQLTNLIYRWISADLRGLGDGSIVQTPMSIALLLSLNHLDAAAEASLGHEAIGFPSPCSCRPSLAICIVMRIAGPSVAAATDAVGVRAADTTSPLGSCSVRTPCTSQPRLSPFISDLLLSAGGCGRPDVATRLTRARHGCGVPTGCPWA